MEHKRNINQLYQHREQQSEQEQIKEKKIKLQNKNNQEITASLQGAKDYLKQVEDSLFIDLNQPQQSLLNDIESVLQTVKEKLKTIQENDKIKNFQNLLYKRELNEQQYIDQFKQTLKTNIVRCYTDTDLQIGQEENSGTIEYLNPIFQDIKLIQKFERFYTCEEGQRGYSKIYLQINNNEEQILYNFHLVGAYALNEEVIKPTYNKRFVHVQNLKNFIEKTLDISSETYKNINIDKLFDKFTDLFWEEQDEHCGFEFDEDMLDGWEDDDQQEV